MQNTLSEFDPSDPQSLSDFLALHNQAHIDLAQTMGSAGIRIDAPPLDGAIDDDWIARHYLLHKALNTALGVPGQPGLSQPAKTLKDPATLAAWLQINDLDHQLYQRAVGGS